MIIDGKKIAEDVFQTLEKQRAGMSRAPRLGIVLGGGNAATASYVRIKALAAERLGVELVREELPNTASVADAIAAVKSLAGKCDGVVVQLPLPQNIDTEKVLAAIPSSKDVDALGGAISCAAVLEKGVCRVTDEATSGNFSAEKLLYPFQASAAQEVAIQSHSPVAEAMMEIFSRADVSVAGKKAVVVGAGRLVGVPCAALLRAQGAHVSVVTQVKGSLDELKDADIVVLGVGEPHMIKPEMLKKGVALIDAGTSESNGKLAGDADPSCAEIASVFTPVPGGVGPIAIAMLFKNLFALAEK